MKQAKLFDIAEDTNLKLEKTPSAHREISLPWDAIINAIEDTMVNFLILWHKVLKWLFMQETAMKIKILKEDTYRK